MTRQIPFIDIHTHLFNGRYLPLHGILRSWGVPRITARALTVLLVPLVGKSRFEYGPQSDDNQDDVIAALEEGSVGRIHRTILKRLEKAMRKSAKSSLDDQSHEENLQDMMLALEDLYGQYVNEKNTFTLSSNLLIQKSFEPENTSDEPSELLEQLDEILMPAFLDAAHHAEGNGYFEGHDHGHDPHSADADLDGFGNKAFPAQQAGTLLKMLIFFLSMFLSERNRYRALQRDYARNKPADGYDPEHLISLLPDMRRAYERVIDGSPKKPYFSASTQVARTVSLSKETDGVIIPFGTVDPFRGDGWKTNVRHAQNLGVTHFKIYPPMGFRPISRLHDSEDPIFAPIELSPAPEYREYKKQIKVKNEPETERAMADIIRYFSENDLGLFTHCTPLGFEAREGFGVNCHPAFWASAMEEYAATDLRLCLGHGGGATDVDFGGWLAEEEDWPKTMAYRGLLMCKTYRNVYMGLGYLIPLLKSSGRDKILKRLRSVLKQEDPALDGGHAIKTKLIFGTDWSMPQMIGETRSFLNVFLEFFEHPDFQNPELCISDAPELIMSGNAKAYLGID